MLGPFLRYAVQRKGRRGMPTTLVDYTEQGARIIDKPSDIKKKNVELTEENIWVKEDKNTLYTTIN